MGIGALCKSNLYANLKKHRFSTDEVHFLGYIVSPSGIHMELKRFESIKNWPNSQPIKEIQVFIDFPNFHWRFIWNFDVITGPLTLILKTGLGTKSVTPVIRDCANLFQSNPILFLTPEAKKSFQKLKKAVCKELVLRYFAISKLIKLKTDTSGKAIEGVLYQ